MRANRRIWAVAVKADILGGFPQDGVVLCAMHVMTVETGDAACVHQALHEIVALHAVLVRGTVGKVRERSLAQFVLFELPEVDQILTHVEADRPIIVFAFDRILPWLAL